MFTASEPGSRRAARVCLLALEGFPRAVPSSPWVTTEASYLQLFDFLLELEPQSLFIFHFALELTVFKILPVGGMQNA